MSAPTTGVPGSVQRGTKTQPDTQVQQQQDIANLAYALWQQRGCPQGSSEQDWFEAERKLQNEQSSTLTRR
jgi:hypothetical protein